MKNFETIKYICGIDTLYYFCESSFNYDDLFLDILDQMECVKGKFEKKEIEYDNADWNDPKLVDRFLFRQNL